MNLLSRNCGVAKTEFSQLSLYKCSLSERYSNVDAELSDARNDVRNYKCQIHAIFIQVKKLENNKKKSSCSDQRRTYVFFDTGDSIVILMMQRHIVRS